MLEDLAKLPVGFAQFRKLIDYNWENFLVVRSMITLTGDLEFGDPKTWFVYECK